MEFVYVVKRTDLFDLHFPHGFLPAGDDGEVARYLSRARGRGFFVERRHAEEDSTLKQIIPYTLIVRGDDEVLLLRRSKAGGDARLHDKLSIGAGGHINPPDAEAGGDVIESCAMREIEEELAFDGPCAPRAVGVINDDSNPVGSVHFGVVHVARLDEVRVRETELLSAEFISRARLRQMAADDSVNLESWSRLIAARLDEALA